MERISKDLLLAVIMARRHFKDIDERSDLNDTQKHIRKQLFVMIRNFVIQRVLETRMVSFNIAIVTGEEEESEETKLL